MLTERGRLADTLTVGAFARAAHPVPHGVCRLGAFARRYFGCSDALAGALLYRLGELEARVAELEGRDR